ncbi:MAG: DUF721 domain-containing protein [Candidatus Omnitrophica bacterium]|nr:DUF721 domain-containing protein [Candidatus Omnitrophota bacterium]
MQDLAQQHLSGVEGFFSGALKKVLTKSEMEHIKINYFKNGSLHLFVDSSSWLYSLNLKKETILKQLQRENKNIKDLKFRIGDVK